MRITIDRTHDKYLQFLASELDASPKEVINFLLWKLRESKYSFNGQLPILQTQNQPVNHYFDPNTFERATAMSALSFQPQECEAQEIDPVIERFISLGVCNEF